MARRLRAAPRPCLLCASRGRPRGRNDHLARRPRHGSRAALQRSATPPRRHRASNALTGKSGSTASTPGVSTVAHTIRPTLGGTRSVSRRWARCRRVAAKTSRLECNRESWAVGRYWAVHRRVNRQVRLKSRPSGVPEAEHFEIVEAPVPDLSDGRVLVRNIYLSFDRAMRGWVSAVAN